MVWGVGIRISGFRLQGLGLIKDFKFAPFMFVTLCFGSQIALTKGQLPETLNPKTLKPKP